MYSDDSSMCSAAPKLPNLTLEVVVSSRDEEWKFSGWRIVHRDCLFFISLF